MALEFQGGCTSASYCKDVDNMLPFNPHSVWNFAANDHIRKLTTNPIVTGTSVLGIKFDEGVMICADTLGSYGSMAKYFNCQRVMKVNDQTLLGAGGDIADFQYLQSVIEQLVIDDECLNDGPGIKPKSLHCWLTRFMYNRRSKFEPLWNVFAVGGLQDKKPFLGYVDKLGMAYEADTVTSGFGSYFAQPILRDATEKAEDISQYDAQTLLHQCMQVLYKRDARSLPRYTLGVANKEGVKIVGPIDVTVDWNLATLAEDNK